MKKATSLGIAVLGYKRKDLLATVLSAIPAYIEDSVTIFLDAPAKEKDRALCNDVRLIAEHWAKHRNKASVIISDQNLGSVGSIPRAVTQVLQNHESVIVLEDDCVPSEQFFDFCKEMLERYAEDSRIGTISGSCLLPDDIRLQCNFSYYFSEFTHTWGWATWRRAWSNYDHSLESISWTLKQNNSRLFRTGNSNNHWRRMGINHNNYPHRTSWDFRWLLCSAANNLLCVVPNGNMVQNVGFDPHSTHTKTACPILSKSHDKIRLPLVHPLAIHPWSTADSWWFNTLISKAPLARGKRFIRRLVHKHLH